MDYIIKTDKGKFRKENQDNASIAFLGDWSLAVLCDGMGGHFGGSLCSQKTIDYLFKYFYERFNKDINFDDKKSINKWFNNALSYVKKSLKKIVEDNKDYEDMGTTLTAALVFNLNKEAYIFNIGDSRTYAYNGLLHQITTDQNLLHQLVKIKNVDIESAKLLPDANKLVSCLGPKKTMKCDSFLLKSDEKVKYLLLTSDGVHDYIDKPNIEQILQDKKLDLESKCTKLIKIAKTNMSKDNLTVLLLEF
ncbi:protein phosphatase 2C domain-containing protein [Mycoplasmopsis arginini]|uniref:Protein phosphatase 2C domain-containing protein n=1 Tax=Mycoplasmopsis arginini TaxID=2094 RepID=A0ABZ2AJ58_MYCAR|nr:protein phosphatase 2C domain-containing protein [Mycoplasmopsis arginini]WVN21958.1 protein phosphatase 2C domain-containing protein [Mycoplasmopsis arginini]VEU81970.1 Serine/threonine phosphatase stp [Mycoplasmopsis arginini]